MNDMLYSVDLADRQRCKIDQSGFKRSFFMQIQTIVPTQRTITVEIPVRILEPYGGNHGDSRAARVYCATQAGNPVILCAVSGGLVRVEIQSG